MTDIMDNHILGRVIGKIHVIEFQKRGLPHAHILLILNSNDKPRSCDDYDKLVSAEIPDSNDPLLYETVTKFMIHGPCHILPNMPCIGNFFILFFYVVVLNILIWVDNKCSKNFPKEFTKDTISSKDGFPLYRRRNDNKKIVCKQQILDNRSVVPYNPFLCTKYNAHINVEICNSVQAVKYLYKYVYKGHDKVMAEFKNAEKEKNIDDFLTTAPNARKINKHDEIETYINARYISASEAVWRILGFSLHSDFLKS